MNDRIPHRKFLIGFAFVLGSLCASQAHALEFAVSLDGNLYDFPSITNKGDQGEDHLGGRIGIHSALNIPISSSQMDWRMAGTYHVFPRESGSFLAYTGPQYRFNTWERDWELEWMVQPFAPIPL
jgi:hypothetical protein